MVEKTYVGAAASEYETNNAKPVDDHGHHYHYRRSEQSPLSIIILSRFRVLRRGRSIVVSDMGRGRCAWTGCGVAVGIDMATGGRFHG